MLRKPWPVISSSCSHASQGCHDVFAHGPLVSRHWGKRSRARLAWTALDGSSAVPVRAGFPQPDGTVVQYAAHASSCARQECTIPACRGRTPATVPYGVRPAGQRSKLTGDRLRIKGAVSSFSWLLGGLPALRPAEETMSSTLRLSLKLRPEGSERLAQVDRTNAPRLVSSALGAPFDSISALPGDGGLP